MYIYILPRRNVYIFYLWPVLWALCKMTWFQTSKRDIWVFNYTHHIFCTNAAIGRCNLHLVANVGSHRCGPIAIFRFAQFWTGFINHQPLLKPLVVCWLVISRAWYQGPKDSCKLPKIHLTSRWVVTYPFGGRRCSQNLADEPSPKIRW